MYRSFNRGTADRWALNNDVQIKNSHYILLYAEVPTPIVFLPVADSTSDRVNEETLRFLCVHANREGSALAGEVTGIGSFPLHPSSVLANLKGSFGLMLEKAAVMSLTIPLDNRI